RGEPGLNNPSSTGAADVTARVRLQCSKLLYGTVWRGRHEMHHVIAIVAEIAEKSRQHRGCPRLRIVHQDDALAGILQSSDQQLDLLFRRHPDPVADPEIRAEYGDLARLQQIEQGRRGFEVGKTEERRGGRARLDTMEGHFVGCNAAVDFI